MTNHTNPFKRVAYLTGFALLTYIAQIKPAFAAGEYVLIAGLIGLMILALGFIFIPSYIAFKRGHPYRWLILLINLVLGGTIFVWFIVFFWALQEIEQVESTSAHAKDDLTPLLRNPDTARIEPDLNTEQPQVIRSVLEPNAVETLQRIKLLWEAGAISSDEYDALRKPILNQYIFKME